LDKTDIKLTAYSHGAGCGCKISPAVLDKILHSSIPSLGDPDLIVGNKDRDDAAVLDLGNGTALISTTDFFMPIVDDAFDFGRIASANAISDVYAMGGRPVLAIAILGWPIDKLAPEIAQKVLEGARHVCAEAGITLAGGHSIDCPEPVFGLAVNGIVNIENLRQNSTATPGCRLYLTKPLGVGILSTAQKKGLLQPDDQALALKSMTMLNKAGETFGKLDYVKALTDVTGFGLLGHLSEMCEGSGLTADIEFDKVPVIDSLQVYLDQNCVPGGAVRNWKSYGHKVNTLSENKRHILSDPQTSGGLLVAVSEENADEFELLLNDLGFPDKCCKSFGFLLPGAAKNFAGVKVITGEDSIAGTQPVADAQPIAAAEPIAAGELIAERNIIITVHE
jgi:selenide,water dikinase